MEVKESIGGGRRECCVPIDKVTHGEIWQTTSWGKCATPRHVITSSDYQWVSGRKESYWLDLELAKFWSGNVGGCGREALGQGPSEMEHYNATNLSFSMKA